MTDERFAPPDQPEPRLGIWCAQCGCHTPLSTFEISQPDSQEPWGDIVCSVCRLVIITIIAKEAGVYGIQKLNWPYDCNSVPYVRDDVAASSAGEAAAFRAAQSLQSAGLLWSVEAQVELGGDPFSEEDQVRKASEVIAAAMPVAASSAGEAAATIKIALEAAAEWTAMFPNQGTASDFDKACAQDVYDKCISALAAIRTAEGKNAP